MKFIRYTLVLALISSGGLFGAPAKPAKDAKYKKIEARKKTTGYRKEAPKAKTADKYGKPKDKYKKIEPKKHEKGLRKPTTKAPSVKSTAKDRPEAPVAKKVEPSTLEKAAEWLGLGTAGTAATKAYTYQKTSGYHVGPRGWHHNFGPGWGDKGWVEGVNEHGNWVFAGYRPDWWKEQPEYSSYYHNVILPMYRKTTEYQRLHNK